MSHNNIKMSWVHPSIKVRKMSWGQGLFTNKKITKDSVVIIFGGYVMSVAQFNRLPKYLQEFPYNVTEDFLFGPIRKEDVLVSERLNHSCNANAGFKGQIVLVALRDIYPNEHVTIDYATCVTTDGLEFECKCGESICRKKFTGNDWESPELQKRYAGHFLPYIQDKIDKLKK